MSKAARQRYAKRVAWFSLAFFLASFVIATKVTFVPGEQIDKHDLEELGWGVIGIFAIFVGRAIIRHFPEERFRIKTFLGHMCFVFALTIPAIVLYFLADTVEKVIPEIVIHGLLMVPKMFAAYGAFCAARGTTFQKDFRALTRDISGEEESEEEDRAA